MTEKLYEKDSMLRSCTATVTDCQQKDDHYEISLDRTVIFPEGGGQLSDQGLINDIPVYYAADDGAQVLHYTRKPLPVGTPVTVTLNWEVRLDRMQQHCGEHILSYAFWKTCGANNVGFHMNEDSVFIDLDQEIDEETAKKAELAANACVWANEPIRVHFVQDSELGNYPLRKQNDKLRGTIRLVDIQNGDICTCCGTHPPFTGMVGSIQILRFAHHKEGSRIEFLCGKRALTAMHQRNALLEQTSNFLSVKVDDVLTAVEKLHREIAHLKETVRNKTIEFLAAELPKVVTQSPQAGNGTKVVLLTLEASVQDGKSAMKLLSHTPHILAGVLTKDGTKIMYQFALTDGAKGDCKLYCQLAAALYQGRGGGCWESAQGGGIAGADWKERAALLKQQILQAMDSPQ